MKLVLISDTHKDYRKLDMPKEGDILIHAGDIDIYRYEREFEDFNDWLGTLPYKYKIIIAGNHDGFFEDSNYGWITSNLTNGIYLENCGINIEGVRFYGSPITPNFCNWSFMRQRGPEIAAYWRLIPDDTNILITHGAPYGILDKTTLENGNEGSREGDLDLRNRVKELKQLKIHVFGHFHRNYGIEEHNGVRFINASVMNENYDLVNKPIVIDI